VKNPQKSSTQKSGGEKSWWGKKLVGKKVGGEKSLWGKKLVGKKVAREKI
jgi:hypothetical protein